ncbi:unnamed protein product [Plutella xylostella]|uniref:(diamondback moth) hypothetical protein n=1 Tax=Plutella xylostella TaxID=51655 RepID=A0A8S4D091_PLUXY|nr:unnamed protein product [Plutella xylostella]
MLCKAILLETLVFGVCNELLGYDTIVVDNLLNISLNDDQWRQASLPVRNGGLGIRRIQDTGLEAFLASTYGVVELVARILSLNDDECRLLFVSEALEEWKKTCPGQRIPTEPQTQRQWDDVHCQMTLAQLLESATGPDLARLKAASTCKSGAWLHALPSPQLGTLLDNNTLRVAAALRVGCNVGEEHRCVCGATADRQGHHGLGCTRCAGRFPRHHALNDIIRRALVIANIPCTLEPPGLCRLDGKRPDGLTLVPWERGRCLLWDATCVSTFAASHINGTIRQAGSAAKNAARHKHTKYNSLKATYIFIPVAFETTGVWGEEAKRFIKEIARRLIERGQDRRCLAYLTQRLSLAIQRGNAASIMEEEGTELELEALYRRYCVRLKHALFVSALCVTLACSVSLLCAVCVLNPPRKRGLWGVKQPSKPSHVTCYVTSQAGRCCQACVAMLAAPPRQPYQPVPPTAPCINKPATS